MPASKDYTLIKLMRGSTDSIDNWIPEVGEPVIDLETSTLRYGDGISLRGIPLNSVTCHSLKDPVLNDQKTWGRFFISGGTITGLPEGCLTTDSYFLIVETPEVGSLEVFQTLKVLTGTFQNRTFIRVSTTGGLEWTPWIESSGRGFSYDGSGASTEDKNLSSFIYTSQVYVSNYSGGPDGTDGCDGLLFTYRSSPESEEIYQILYVLKCEKYAGRVYQRYSATANTSFDAPGYNWIELTDYTHRDLQNATGILPITNGGTGRDDGTVSQADVALQTYYGVGADLAEIYISDCYLEKGDPVCVSLTEKVDITKPNEENKQNFLGVVSTKPGFILNPDQKDNKYAYAIARVGKVPAFVYGPCKKGDKLFLTSDGKLVSMSINKNNSLETFCCFANETHNEANKKLIEIII